MGGIRKVLLLGVLLLLPVLAFLFLQTFGRNAYKLRTYLPERIDSARVGAKFIRDTTFHRVADEAPLLAAPGAQPFRVGTDLKGRVVVLALLTGAPDAPDTRRVLSQLARVQTRYAKEAQLKLLVIAADSGAALADQAEQAGAIGGKWTFAYARSAALAQWRRELRETQTRRPNGRLWLLDPDRYVRGIYDGTDPRDGERLLTEIDVLLRVLRQPARR